MDTQIVDHELEVEDGLPTLEDEPIDYYFRDGHWGQCLELLSHLCQYGDSINLVCGPSGIGKTAMQQALLRNEADKFNFCVVNATPYLTGESLQEYIDPVIEQHHQSNKDVVLLIDDAQELSMDVLALVLQLKQKSIGRNALKIVLFATADLERNAMQSILKDEFVEHVHIIEIEPLTLTEVEAFLMQQWRLTNNRNDLPLDKSKLKKIFALSGGVPGAVLRLAKDLFGSVKSSTKREADGLSPVMVGLTVSFGILFCLLAFLWPSADDSLLNKNNGVESLTVATTQTDVDSADADDAAIISAEQTTGTAPVQVTADEAEQHEQVADEHTMPLPEPIAAVETAAELNEPVAIATPKVMSDEEKMARLEQKLASMQQQLAGEQQARRAAEQKYKSALTKPVTPPTQLPAKTKVQAKSLKTPSRRSAAQQSTLIKSLSRAEQSILSMPSKNYTLQILGLRDEAKVRDFIRKHKLSDKAYYYKATHKGKPWFVVIYGTYNDKMAARAAIAKMPLALRKLQPWPREFSHVQTSIRQSRS